MADVSLAAAAATLGVSVETVRRRIKRGALEAHHSDAGGLLVTIPDAVGVPETFATSEEVTHLQARIDQAQAEIERLHAELAHAREMLTEIRRQRDGLAQRVAHLERQIDQDAVERSEMRRLLVAAQSQVTTLLPAPRERTSSSRTQRLVVSGAGRGKGKSGGRS